MAARLASWVLLVLVLLASAAPALAQESTPNYVPEVAQYCANPSDQVLLGFSTRVGVKAPARVVVLCTLSSHSALVSLKPAGATPDADTLIDYVYEGNRTNVDVYTYKQDGNIYFALYLAGCDRIVGGYVESADGAVVYLFTEPRWWEVGRWKLLPLNMTCAKFVETYGSKPGDLLSEIARGFTHLGTLIHAAMKLLVEGIVMFPRVVGPVVIEGFKTLGRVLGKPGDPEAIYWAGMYRTQLAPYLNSPVAEVVETVKSVLNCSRPLSDVRGVLKTYRPQDLNRTICEVEDSAPQGLLGFFSSAFTVFGWAGNTVVLVARYFVLINAAIMLAILLFGAAKAFQTHRVEYLIGSIRLIASIVKFYWNVLMWFINLLIRIGQLIVQAIPAIVAIVEQLASVVEKIVRFIVGLILLKR